MRAYRAALRLLPASFRSEYADEMRAVVARRLRDARGPLGRARVWAEALADVASCAAVVHLDLLRQDLRHLGRSLARARGFALTVVAVTALGVGATTAAFSVTDHVLIRPLPFPDPERLVQLWQTARPFPGSRIELSPANFRDYQARARSYESIGAFNRGSVTLVGEGEPERVESATLGAEVVPLLGVRPLLGRGFAPEEDREGAPGTVLLSHGLWQQRFAADPGVVGRRLLIDDEPHQVIGVMPPGFHFPRRETRLWRPLRLERAAFEARDDLWLETIARLRPGVSLASARAEAALLAAQLEREHPRENANAGARLDRLRDAVSRQSRALVVALFGAALGVLLIACTNLASLFLARALERRQELAVRTALGAGRERLARQLLTESLLLAGLGGLLGVLLAALALPLVARLVPSALPVAEAPPLDLRVLGFALVATLVTAVGFGLAPVLRGLSAPGAAALREGSRSVAGGRERLRSALVAGQVALSIVLLVASGLLIRALLRVQAIDPGFRPEGVLTLRTTLPLPKYQAVDERVAFHAGVLEAVRALPGVTSAAYTSALPMVMTGGIWTIEAEGRPTAPSEPRTASIRYVTPGYFATLGIPLVAGRDVGDRDDAGALQVAVVSRSFVERYWPGENPIGRRFRFGLLGSGTITDARPFQDRTIVGVVGNVMVRGLERLSEPQVYLPHRQQPADAMSWYTPQDLAVRHDGDAAALVPAIRRIVARADPAQPVADVRSLASVVAGQTTPRRVQVIVLSGFAALAVVLAGFGIHGLLAFVVAGRAREIGVRRAVGATTPDVLGLVLRHGLRLGATGVVCGLVLAWAAGRSLEALLAGVSPRDLATFGAAGALAIAAALAGSLVPAWSAARVDPLSAMRVD